MEKFYERLRVLPAATHFFPPDHKQAAFVALDLSSEEQKEFEELLDELCLRGLAYQLPRFWPKHSNSYQNTTDASFANWFYMMVSNDPSFLHDFAKALKFVKSSFPVLWECLSQHKLYYLCTLVDKSWKIGQSVLKLLSVRPNKKRFTHQGRFLEITDTHLIIDGKRVLASDLFGDNLSCTLCELFALFDKSFAQAPEPTMAALPAASPAAAPAALQPLQGQDQVLDQNPCSICLENKSNVTLLTCGHLCVCIGCYNNFIVEKPECPTCRAAVTGSVKTFY